MRIDSLAFEKNSVETKGNSKNEKNNYQLKEADQIIEELTNSLQSREAEMKIALSENDKLMDRYRKLENELVGAHNAVVLLKGQHNDEIENAENRIKLTQEQAMS